MSDSVHGQMHELLLDFGKHKGRHIHQVDDGYVEWMIKSFSVSSQWHKAAAEVLSSRRKTKAKQRIGSVLTELKACSISRDVSCGRTIHAKAVENGYESNMYVATALVKMYSNCGSMVDARGVFNIIQQPDVVSWNALLWGYAENGEGHVALELFSKMKADGCEPNSVTYLAVLKACTSLAVSTDGRRRGLEIGRQVHLEVGGHLNLYVQNTLIDMYAKCNSMVEARKVFDSISKRDTVSWNALVLGYAENGEAKASLELFFKMKADDYVPNSVTYVAVLKACTFLAVNGARKAGLEMGRKIHLQIRSTLDLYVQNTLIDMYTKCGSMGEAHEVFDNIKKPDVVSWTALLLGYAENGEGHTSLELFSRMKSNGCVPNSVTYVAALKACTSLAMIGECSQGLAMGSKIHMELGAHLNPYVQSALIEMYAKCGSMADARRVFDNIQKPDVVSWTPLILGYAENGEGHASLELFSKMKRDGCVPDSAAFVAALKACTSLAVSGEKSRGLQIGKEIHMQVGKHLDLYVQNTLIDMYAKCSSMVDARRVFLGIQDPDVVSWNALLLGYAETGEGNVTLELLSRMKTDGCTPDSVTYVAALNACISLAANGERVRGLKFGSELHLEIGDNASPYTQSMLIDMYANCGDMVEARKVFDDIQKPDVVSWTALILGYAENGEGHVSLELFEKMKDHGCMPDSVTFVAALKACSLVGALVLGRKLHSDMSDFTAYVVTCLVDFYAKCSSMVEARAVFDQHPDTRDVTTWNALLAGYSSCGDTASVFILFEQMQDAGFQPDGVTFVCILLCCSHAGLAEKARQYLEAMPKHRVTPDVHHYSCTVDVLCRANQLNEAISVLRGMPCSPNVVTWNAVLAACRKRGNVELGKMVFQSIVEMDSKGASPYVTMAHIYGTLGAAGNRAFILNNA